MLRVTPLALPGVLLLEPQVHADQRGMFFESFNARAFREATRIDLEFVQDNHARSSRNVLRGLHYQQSPGAQGKLVRVILGEVFDVAVDIRPGSPSFGRWTATRLSADNRLQVWIPPGFAHGYLVLSEVAELLYKATDYYAPALERCVRWDDPALAIDWPLAGAPVLSARDAAGPTLAEATGRSV